ICPEDQASTSIKVRCLAFRSFRVLRIMAIVDGLAACFCIPLALRRTAWKARASDDALAAASCLRPHLFFRLLLPVFSDPWAHRAKRNPARRHLSSGGRPVTGPLGTLLVRTDSAVVVERKRHVDDALLGRHDRLLAPRPELVAARHVGRLLHLLSLVHRRRPGLFLLPVRRHVARSRIYFAFFR